MQCTLAYLFDLYSSRSLIRNILAAQKLNRDNDCTSFLKEGNQGNKDIVMVEENVSSDLPKGVLQHNSKTVERKSTRKTVWPQTRSRSQTKLTTFFTAWKNRGSTNTAQQVHSSTSPTSRQECIHIHRSTCKHLESPHLLAWYQVGEIFFFFQTRLNMTRSEMLTPLLT